MSLLKDILTVVDGGVIAVTPRAGFFVAFELEAHEVRATPNRTHIEDSLRDAIPIFPAVAAEPQLVPTRNIVLIHSVNKSPGFCDQAFGFFNGVLKCILPIGSTIVDRNPSLVVDMPGDTEIAGKLDLGTIHNGGVQVVGHPISIDISEPV